MPSETAFVYADPSSWEAWRREYRYGAFYLFPPLGVIEAVDELRRRHDPLAHAICQAHVSLTEPVPRPLTNDDVEELRVLLTDVPAFTVRYVNLHKPPPASGVVYLIEPAGVLRQLRDAVHAADVFSGVALNRSSIPPHMTVAEFISPEDSLRLEAELSPIAPEGEWVCDAVEYAVPDEAFRFQRRLVLPLAPLSGT